MVQSSSRRPRDALTDRDRRVLVFAAEHKLVLAQQIVALLGAPSLDAATRRLRDLTRMGLVREDRLFYRKPPCWQITAAGLGAVESRLGTPNGVDRALYSHDVGVGWLWLAAERGAWGDVRTVVSERQMRSHDRARAISGADGTEGRYGVRLGGTGPRGQPRLHYPDLLLIDGAGHRIAVELELTAKQPHRLAEILAGFAVDARIDAVLYVVDRSDIASRLRTAARKHGISDLVRVQRLEWGAASPPSARDRAAQRAAISRGSASARAGQRRGRAAAAER